MPPVVLQTTRLVLRPWRWSDVEAAFEYARDREFFRFLPTDFVESLGDEERFIAVQVLTDWDIHPAWAITRDDVPIGGINVRIVPNQGVAELGYGVGRAYWRSGYTTDAARAVVDWAFATHPVERLAATADPRNIGSWRVMEKLGMRREGVLRGHRLIRGERADTVVYSILRNEWPASNS